MKERLSQTEETKQDGQDSAKSSKKERILEELKTEPLKYVLEIANVTNAQELLDKLSKFETKAGFENIFTKLKSVRNLEKIKVVYKSLNYLGDSRSGYTNAAYQEASNTLSLDWTYGNSANIGDFYVSVLHELFHEVFRGADIASGLNILYGLTDIKNTIQKLPVHNKYRHLYNAVLSNVSGEDKQSYYGLSSVDEFISEAYSNPEFQKFLKSVTMQKNSSASSKSIDLLLSVTSLNARIITREIKEEDAFAAFQKIDLESLNLLEDFEKNVASFKQRHAVSAEPVSI